MKAISLLMVIFLVGCATKPVLLPPPKCEYTVAGKCKQFSADDVQGATTYGHSQ
mgnify:CR=1 FL=1